MTKEEQKILDYWVAVETKYCDKERNGSEETHYQHALSMIRKLSHNTGQQKNTGTE